MMYKKKLIFLFGLFVLVHCYANCAKSFDRKQVKKIRKYSEHDRIKSCIRYLIKKTETIKKENILVDYLNKKLIQSPRLINVLNTLDTLLLKLFRNIVLYNRQETLQLLAVKGINLNKCGKNGTILHMAAVKANYKMITFLCCLLRVNINAVDGNGNTALHLVASFDDYEGIRILLEHEADVSLCNKKWLLPLNVTKNEAIREMLFDAQCDQEVAKIFGSFGENRIMKCQEFEGFHYDKRRSAKWKI